MTALNETAPGASAGGRLEFAWLELTHACNLRCEQCYTHSTPGTPHRSLSTERWLLLLDEIVAAGGSSIQFTGGEATSHPDWRLLVERASSRGLAIELFTNGTTLEEDDLDFLARHGVALAISLHSHEPAVHDAITGVEGSFVATLRTIRRACDRGLHLRLAVVLMESNATHGPMVESLARRQGVLTPLTIDPVRPTGRGRGATSPGDAAVCTACRSSSYAALHAGAGNRAQDTCWDGKIAIDPEGVVTPCIFSRSASVGNVLETPLRSVLAEGPLAELWALTVDDVESCRECDRKAHCFDCRALPLSILGDLRAKNPRCDYQPPGPAPRLDPASPVRLGLGLESFACGEERLLLDRLAGKVHALNQSASFLLGGLEQGSKVEELAAELAAETGAEPGVVAADLGAARESMLASGLLRLAPAEAPARTEVQSARWPILPGPAKSGSLGDSREGPPRMADGDHPAALVALPHLHGIVQLEFSAAAGAILRPWLAAHLLEEVGEHRILGRIQVHTRKPSEAALTRHYVLTDGLPEGDTISSSGLRSLVEGAWCSLVGDDPTPSFHAAAMSGEGGALIVPGLSGAGKSLLCTHAVVAGAHYLSDEMVAWDLASGVVTGLPKPVTVKGEGERLLPPTARKDLTALDPLDPDEQRWLSLPAGSPAKIRAVILPDREREGGLEEVAPAVGAAALLQSCFDLPVLDRSEIEALIAACETTPIYSLGTRDLTAAGSALASLAHSPGAG